MSEQLPTTNPDEAHGAQFDAEAAQKAKEFLAEGVNRDEDLWHSSRYGEILDERGHVLTDTASHIRNKFKTENDLITMSDEHMKRLDRAMEDVKAGKSTPLGSSSGVIVYQMADAASNRDRHAKKREEMLQIAQQHYQDNQAAYVAQAVEDANAAGHDITLGGHHFPAQTSEHQPPQGERAE